MYTWTFLHMLFNWKEKKGNGVMKKCHFMASMEFWYRSQVSTKFSCSQTENSEKVFILDFKNQSGLEFWEKIFSYTFWSVVFKISIRSHRDGAVLSLRFKFFREGGTVGWKQLFFNIIHDTWQFYRYYWGDYGTQTFFVFGPNWT